MRPRKMASDLQIRWHNLARFDRAKFRLFLIFPSPVVSGFDNRTGDTGGGSMGWCCGHRQLWGDFGHDAVSIVQQVGRSQVAT